MFACLLVSVLCVNLAPLDVDEDIEGAIVRRENATQIRNISLSKGMRTLRQDGWAKAFKGVTSVKEIMRVTEES